MIAPHQLGLNDMAENSTPRSSAESDKIESPYQQAQNKSGGDKNSKSSSIDTESEQTDRSESKRGSYISYNSSHSSTKSTSPERMYSKGSNNVESEDSFISSSSKRQNNQEESSGDSFSSSLPIDLTGQVRDSNVRSEESLTRPVAPMELLDDSSQMNDKPKFIIGHVYKRASSVSSSTSSLQSSTRTITIDRDEIEKRNKKPIIVVSSNKKDSPNYAGKQSATSSISDFSLVKEKTIKKKSADKTLDSASGSSLISSVSNSRSNKISATTLTNNRVKSAKTTLTRQALDKHNRSMSYEDNN